MSLKYQAFVLGPIDNNTYLLWDDETKQCVVIDPSFEPNPVIEAIQSKHLILSAVWLTHAHFDHIAGINDIIKAAHTEVPVWLHADDRELYKSNGLATSFGFPMPELPASTQPLVHGQNLQIGKYSVEVRHTPGHCPGHVIFYAAEIATAFTGDLIFWHGVGRTDLPGSSQVALMSSIQTQVVHLPGETVLLSGHGPETSVKAEVENNPYIN
jgi:glyoxylase-like metal-dependent hydrolase (beta-lactamase superfamily II)